MAAPTLAKLIDFSKETITEIRGSLFRPPSLSSPLDFSTDLSIDDIVKRSQGHSAELDREVERFGKAAIEYFTSDKRYSSVKIQEEACEAGVKQRPSNLSFRYLTGVTAAQFHHLEISPEVGKAALVFLKEMKNPHTQKISFDRYNDRLNGKILDAFSALRTLYLTDQYSEAKELFDAVQEPVPEKWIRKFTTIQMKFLRPKDLVHYMCCHDSIQTTKAVATDTLFEVRSAILKKTKEDPNAYQDLLAELNIQELEDTLQEVRWQKLPKVRDLPTQPGQEDIEDNHAFFDERLDPYLYTNEVLEKISTICLRHELNHESSALLDAWLQASGGIKPSEFLKSEIATGICLDATDIGRIARSDLSMHQAQSGESIIESIFSDLVKKDWKDEAGEMPTSEMDTYEERVAARLSFIVTSYLDAAQFHEQTNPSIQGNPTLDMLQAFCRVVTNSYDANEDLLRKKDRTLLEGIKFGDLNAFHIARDTDAFQDHHVGAETLCRYIRMALPAKRKIEEQTTEETQDPNDSPKRRSFKDFFVNLLTSTSGRESRVSIRKHSTNGLRGNMLFFQNH